METVWTSHTERLHLIFQKQAQEYSITSLFRKEAARN